MARPDHQLWTDLTAHLRRTHPSLCRHWFDDIEPLDLCGGTLKLVVREPVQLKYLQRCCVGQFTEAAQQVTGRLLTVRFVGEADLDHAAPVPASPGRPAAVSVPAADASSNGNGLLSCDDDMPLSPDFSFANFIVSPGNRLAHAAAIAVARQPGQAYNPLFIHGGVGLGKTHLLQAICQAAMQVDPPRHLCYISCNGFMTQFTDAVQAGQMSDFRYRFRHLDLLVIDDIHDLSSREHTQEEFFHTFNCLYQAAKQIVLSSDAPPNEIPDLEERLTSRFNCGLVARIDKPTFETRVAIIKSKSELRGLHLPDDVVSYVARKIDTNIRELEGTITSIQGLAMANGAPIDLALAKEAIGERPASAVSLHPTIHEIINAVTAYFDVKLTDLLSKRRQKSIALPRQVGMWLARKYTRYSLDEIGGYFGGRDHTTVMHGVKAINRKCAACPVLAQDVARLEQLLLAHDPGHIGAPSMALSAAG